MAVLEIQGNVRDRFIQATVLLYMLDPVRGEPTAYGLEQEPFEIGSSRERLLKRKFLDSIALVSAIRKDGASVSAACLEESRPSGTIVRVASNDGVSAATLCQLQEIIELLNDVASGVKDVIQIEAYLLRLIIKLDIEKIRGYIARLCDSKGISRQPISTLISRISGPSQPMTLSSSQEFLRWFENFYTIRELPVDASPETLSEYIILAQKAKRDHLGHLETAFSSAGQSLPSWVYTLFKLGRYGIACKALLQFASEFPALFNPMTVGSLQAPLRTRLINKAGEIPLTTVLRRVSDGKEELFKARLAGVWGTTDAEK